MDANSCKKQCQKTHAEVCDTFALEPVRYIKNSSSTTANYFLLAIRFWLELLKRSNVGDFKVFNTLLDNGVDWYSAKVCTHNFLVNPTCNVPIRPLYLTYLCVYQLLKDNFSKDKYYNEFLLTFRRFKKYCTHHELSD